MPDTPFEKSIASDVDSYVREEILNDLMNEEGKISPPMAEPESASERAKLYGPTLESLGMLILHLAVFSLFT